MFHEPDNPQRRCCLFSSVSAGRRPCCLVCQYFPGFEGLIGVELSHELDAIKAQGTQPYGEVGQGVSINSGAHSKVVSQCAIHYRINLQ